MAQIENTNIEHQVDIFFLNLMTNDESFVAWFADLVGRRTGQIIQTSASSASLSPPRLGTEPGQTDIGLFIEAPQKTALLIENKVMSPFTHCQPERYVAECRALRDAGTYEHVLSVIVCPNDYLSRAQNSCDKFDAWVSYEEVAEFVGRSSLLEAAIERCKTGWIAEEIETVTDNFLGYANLVETGIPLLRVKTKPTNKPKQSRTVYFDEWFSNVTHPDLPVIILNHQWQEGRAKLLFRTWGPYRELLEPIVQEDIKGTMFKVDPNRTKSLGLMLTTPVIDNHRSFDGQVDSMIAGIAAVDALRTWFCANVGTALKWRDLLREELI